MDSLENEIGTVIAADKIGARYTVIGIVLTGTTGVSTPKKLCSTPTEFTDGHGSIIDLVSTLTLESDVLDNYIQTTNIMGVTETGKSKIVSQATSTSTSTWLQHLSEIINCRAHHLLHPPLQQQQRRYYFKKTEMMRLH